MHITAYAEPHGSKTWYYVLVDGQLREGYPMKSTRTYSHIHIQRWEGAPEDEWAARFTASPKPIGSKIEYGYVSEVIPIEHRA